MLSFDLLAIFAVKSVMILLAFLYSFLVFYFLRQRPNSFFLINKNCCVFELSVPSVFISLRD